MKPQNFRLGFFTNHLKLVNSITAFMIDSSLLLTNVCFKVCYFLITFFGSGNAKKHDKNNS